ncbi:GMC oxidoreductase [Colletotrichum higginsianum IMI 349063]|uniref:GMC oxidoreductase n=1 Tax=Colletotrichum higginsianum (strain IMI 349063) TaxID=759273 RepID=A0A1B7XR49_COLHI|nr:GMC oxidoreductase [Colletotrichum higginsianum IMI 349063]OBR02243.1 GMC oxidoreductase [Colletotrichum higginsianum IMI 349063]
MTTTVLPVGSDRAYDYVIVGGGTAGCVLGARLAQYQSAGCSSSKPNLKEWQSVLGGDLDYDYGTTEQPNGNSHIRQSRAKVLDGCSSHNTMIAFRPFRYDMKRWVAQGCHGWDWVTMMQHVDQLRNQVQPVHNRHRNQLTKDWVQSCSTAMKIPVIQDFNAEILDKGQLEQGAGFFNIAYNPDTHQRSSASVAYIHPIICGEERRPNLTVLTEAHVSKIKIEKDVATSPMISLKSGGQRVIVPRKEIILCAGAIDTPRLMLLSGLGPKSQLEGLGIDVVKDIPGVGENLQDHPEGIIMWELNRPVPPNQTTMNSDAGLFLRREPTDAAGSDGNVADLMMHCYQAPYSHHTERAGFEFIPDPYVFCMIPNIPRPRSRGRVYLTSAKPAVNPALDFQCFSDPEGYDAAPMTWGIKAARKIARQSPFKGWLKREVAPGPAYQTDDDISKYARSVHHTVYHPCGTTKMGDVTRDEMAVVDPQLRVRGLSGLRIANAAGALASESLLIIDPQIVYHPCLGIFGRRVGRLIGEVAWAGNLVKSAGLLVRLPQFGVSAHAHGFILRATEHVLESRGKIAESQQATDDEQVQRQDQRRHLVRARAEMDVDNPADKGVPDDRFLESILISLAKRYSNQMRRKDVLI